MLGQLLQERTGVAAPGEDVACQGLLGERRVAHAVASERDQGVGQGAGIAHVHRLATALLRELGHDAGMVTDTGTAMP